MSRSRGTKISAGVVFCTLASAGFIVIIIIIIFFFF